MHRRQLLQGLLLPAVATTLLMAQAPAPQPHPTSESLNAAYAQAMQTKDWPHAVAAAQQLVDASATSANLLLLANAQLYATTGHSETGPMEATLATYERARAAAEQEKPAPGQPDQAWKDGMSKILVGKGNALLKMKRTPEAIDNYNRAAELSSNPGLAFFNVCAVLYNIGDTRNSVVACRKSVQADPTRANAWFVLASDLFADLPVTAQGKVAASPETQGALEKYLALAPDGPHAADAKAMLDMFAK